MGVFGKAMAIASGILICGGVLFYWRETYALKVSEERKIELEKQLKELTKSRLEKENIIKKI